MVKQIESKTYIDEIDRTKKNLKEYIDAVNKIKVH
jgi:hypothetical protein